MAASSSSSTASRGRRSSSGPASEESALARDVLGALATIEEPWVRQQAYRAAIMVVEGWGLRSISVEESAEVVAAPSPPGEAERQVSEDDAAASAKRKRRRLEETMSNRIASELDVEEAEKALTQLVPLYARSAMVSSSSLVAFFSEGPAAFLEKVAEEQSSLGRYPCETIRGEKRKLGDGFSGEGVVVRFDERSELWGILDRAGGALERRKAISGLPEFAVELCGSYADAQQFMFFEPAGGRRAPPTVGWMACSYVFVVLFGGFHVRVWRPTKTNLQAVANSVVHAPQQFELEGDSWEYTASPCDVVLIPPGYPHAITYFDSGLVSWGLRFVSPSSRCLLRALRSRFDFDQTTLAVYAHHLLKCINPPAAFDPAPFEPQDTANQFDDLEKEARKARRARFRAKKRKLQPRPDDQPHPTFTFGTTPLDPLASAPDTSLPAPLDPPPADNAPADASSSP